MRLIVHGAGGRLGRRIVARALEAGDVELVAAICRPGDPRTGRDAGEIACGSPAGVPLAPLPERLPAADAAIEVSTPQAMPGLLAKAAGQGIGVVVATTGYAERGRRAIEEAASRVPVLVAPNLASGVAILGRLVARAARLAGEDADFEIVEVHHRHKRDAPSGTALRLADTIASARARAYDEALSVRAGRAGRGERAAPRAPGEIGVHAVRAGDVVGEHTVIIAFGSERLELTHRAHDRTVFADGALKAARFVAALERPGRYRFEDALGG